MTTTPDPLAAAGPLTDDERRALAIRRIKARYDFRVHLGIYLIVNAALVVVWYLASGVTTFFWPILPILGWGIGIVIHGYTVYFPQTATEEQIQREMRRHNRPRLFGGRSAPPAYGAPCTP